MFAAILGLLGKVMGAVGRLLPFLFAYRAGKKAVKAKNTEGELKRAREAKEIWDDVAHADTTTLRQRLRDRAKDRDE